MGSDAGDGQLAMTHERQGLAARGDAGEHPSSGGTLDRDQRQIR